MVKKTMNKRLKYRTEFPAKYSFDYKDPATLVRFLAEGGKIIPSRVSKLSFKQQRGVAAAVKKSRNLGLLPLGSYAYDSSRKIEPLSIQPFEY